MKKNAFTLVELLAVVVILAIVFSITGITVLNVLEDSKKSTYDTQIDMIELSVKGYVSDKKRSLFSDKNIICVTVENLYMEKYIEEIPIDPTTKKEFSRNLGFKVNWDNNKFTYTLVEDVTLDNDCK